MGPIVVALAYLSITVLCVSISSVFVWHGLQDLFRDLMFSLPLAAVITIGLAACDLAILDRRRKGAGIFGLVVVLLFFTALSWAFNFHFIYRTLVSTEIARARFEQASAALEDNLSRAQAALRAKERLPQVRRELDSAFARLEGEIGDRNKPGFGDLARGHDEQVKKIISSIPAEITQLKIPAPSASQDVVKNYIADLRKLAYDEMARAEAGSPWAGGLKELLSIAAQHNQIKKNYPNAEDKKADMLVVGIKQLDDLNAAVERLLTQTFGLESKSTGQPISALPEIKRVSAYGVEMTSVPASIQLGLVALHSEPKDWLAITKVVGAGLLAVFVDLMPLVFAFLLIHPKRRPSNAGTVREAVQSAGDVIDNIFDRSDDQPKNRPPILSKRKAS